MFDPDAAPAPSRGSPDYYRDYARRAAEKYGLDPDLVESVMFQESRGDTNARSNRDARGLMQLKAAAAQDMGVDRSDPLQNIDGGVRYLAKQKKDFGSVELALAAYNAGPRRVREFGGIPPYQETQDYIRNIMSATERKRRASSVSAESERSATRASEPAYPETTLNLEVRPAGSEVGAGRRPTRAQGEWVQRRGNYDPNAEEGSRTRPYFPQNEGEVGDTPAGGFYVAPGGELRRAPGSGDGAVSALPERTQRDQLLGLHKGMMKPYGNAAMGLEWGVNKATGGGADTVTDFLDGLPGVEVSTAREAVAQRERFYEAQARKGRLPGRAGEVVGQALGVAPLASLPGGPVVQLGAGGSLLTNARDPEGVLRDALLGPARVVDKAFRAGKRIGAKTAAEVDALLAKAGYPPAHRRPPPPRKQRR